MLGWMLDEKKVNMRTSQHYVDTSLSSRSHTLLLPFLVQVSAQTSTMSLNSHLSIPNPIRLHPSDISKQTNAPNENMMNRIKGAPRWYETVLQKSADDVSSMGRCNSRRRYEDLVNQILLAISSTFFSFTALLPRFLLRDALW